MTTTTTTQSTKCYANRYQAMYRLSAMRNALIVHLGMTQSVADSGYWTRAFGIALQ